MEKKLFSQLLQGVKEMKEILRGEKPPARVTDVKKGAGGKMLRHAVSPAAFQAKARAAIRTRVRDIRRRLNMTQDQFSMLLRVPRATLRNWEQGRRMPEGPAQALLEVASKHPESVLDALHSKTFKAKAG